MLQEHDHAALHTKLQMTKVSADENQFQHIRVLQSNRLHASLADTFITLNILEQRTRSSQHVESQPDIFEVDSWEIYNQRTNSGNNYSL